MDVEYGTYIDTDEGEEPDPDQLSFQWFNLDEGGVAYPADTAKVAYYACVVLFSWSITFGPVAQEATVSL